MRHKIAAIIAKSGIIPEETLRQYQKWGLLPDAKKIPPPKTAEEFVTRVQRALEEDNIALVKETDLDIVPQYVRTQAVGSLYVAHNEGEMQKGFEVVFGRTLTGEFILPWGGDDISDLLTNGVTHLTFAVANSSSRGEPLRLLSTVYFDEVREVYFGDRKVFIVCRGRKEE